MYMVSKKLNKNKLLTKFWKHYFSEFSVKTIKMKSAE